MEEGEIDVDDAEEEDDDEEGLVLTAKDVVANVDVKDDEIILFVVGTFTTKAIANPRCNDRDDGFIIITNLDDIIIIITVKSSRRELHRVLIVVADKE